MSQNDQLHSHYEWDEEDLVEVTKIAKGLVRLDVYNGPVRASAILTHDEAKRIAIALTTS